MFWFLFACSPPLEVPLPTLAVAPAEVELTAAVGEFATAEVTLANPTDPSADAAPYTPALGLGVTGDVGIRATHADFCVHWDTPACATVIDAPGGAAEVCADGVAKGGDQLALPSGCALPVTVVYAPTAEGEALGALRITTAEGPWAAADAPEVWEVSGDPTDWQQEIGLRGTATAAPVGRLVLDPPLGVFPWRWPDGTADTQMFTLRNSGTAPVRLGAADLACSVAWSLVDAPVQGSTLDAGESVAFTVSHAPTEPDPELCTLGFATADGEASAPAALRFVPDGWSQPPTVAITGPAAGAEVASDERVTVSFTLADDQAPSSGLFITIWSTAQKKTLAQGVGPDDSGVVNFELDKGDLLPGAETLRVSLLDWEGFTTYDAVSFRVDGAATDDADGDSWGVLDGDCDDTEPTVFPGAVESANGVDDDCDTTVDDGAPPLDNDGDGLTEADGDCNDHDAAVLPGAEEVANNVDDDCDDLVDEATLRTDDDGDGYLEVSGDCDDADATFNPSATDTCDGLDHDCDGVLPDCAVAPTGAFITVTPDACHPGDPVSLTATAPAGATLSWSAAGATLPETGAEATWTCPDAPGDVVISVAVTTGAGTVTDSSLVAVVDAGTSLDRAVTLGGGCGAGGAGIAGLGALGLAAARLRRLSPPRRRRARPSARGR